MSNDIEAKWAAQLQFLEDAKRPDNWHGHAHDFTVEPSEVGPCPFIAHPASLLRWKVAHADRKLGVNFISVKEETFITEALMDIGFTAHDDKPLREYQFIPVLQKDGSVLWQEFDDMKPENERLFWSNEDLLDFVVRNIEGLLTPEVALIASEPLSDFTLSPQPGNMHSDPADTPSAV